jgi:hypothetical protein
VRSTYVALCATYAPTLIRNVEAFSVTPVFHENFIFRKKKSTFSKKASIRPVISTKIVCKFEFELVSIGEIKSIYL